MLASPFTFEAQIVPLTLIEQKAPAIKTLCESHKVRRLYAFGSVLTNAFSSLSDVDLMVDFKPMDVARYAENYFSLKFALEDALQRPIDLLEEKALRNPFFKKAVEEQRLLIYGN